MIQNRIKEVVKELGLTQAEFADILGVSLSTAKKQIAAKSMTTKQIEIIADKIKVDPAILLIEPGRLKEEETEKQNINFPPIAIINPYDDNNVIVCNNTRQLKEAAYKINRDYNKRKFVRQNENL